MLIMNIEEFKANHFEDNEVVSSDTREVKCVLAGGEENVEEKQHNYSLSVNEHGSIITTSKVLTKEQLNKIFEIIM